MPVHIGFDKATNHLTGIIDAVELSPNPIKLKRIIYGCKDPIRIDIAMLCTARIRVFANNMPEIINSRNSRTHNTRLEGVVNCNKCVTPGPCSNGTQPNQQSHPQNEESQFHRQHL